MCIHGRWLWALLCEQCSLNTLRKSGQLLFTPRRRPLRRFRRHHFGRRREKSVPRREIRWIALEAHAHCQSTRGRDYFKLTHRKAAATPLSSCLARVALIKESLLTEGSPAYFRTLCILSTQKCLVCGLVKLALAGCSLTVLPGCVWVLLNYVLHTILGSLYNHTKCVA